MHVHSHALEIVKRLTQKGHIAYFAGGWVRDFVMQRESDDIDIATSASPQEILDLFPRTLLVGLQFGVVIVLIDGHPYEVSTFRKDIDYTNGRTPEKIEQTNAIEDAKRRDFTINGMFYDPLTEEIHDYVGGLEDIKRGVVRAIGDPFERFFEDRLRMIRAFRFAARFGFILDHETEEAIRENATLLFPAVAAERIWQEFSKMHAYPNFDRALIEMHRVGLLSVIFRELEHVHLKDLEKWVAPLKHYPEEAPPEFFLQEIFKTDRLEDFIALGKYLKLSNQEIELLCFYVKNRPFEIPKSLYESALFYAHRSARVCLQVYAARLEKDEREGFLQAHGEREEFLADSILRLQTKKPLISSDILRKEGIEPGKQMGLLMKEGEKLAVEHNVKNTKDAISLLKTSPLWSRRETD